MWDDLNFGMQPHAPTVVFLSPLMFRIKRIYRLEPAGEDITYYNFKGPGVDTQNITNLPKW